MFLVAKEIKGGKIYGVKIGTMTGSGDSGVSL